MDKIYMLLNSPIVTPYNLLENVKLKNYEYVKYSKGDNGLIAKIKCLVDDVDTIFDYLFDENDHLQKIYMKQKNNKKLVFDRKAELEESKEFYIKTLSNKLKKDII